VDVRSYRRAGARRSRPRSRFELGESGDGARSRRLAAATGDAAYARSTEQQASGLDPIQRSCQQSSQQILSLIGGSSQRKEAEVQGAVNEAREQVGRAAQALRRAAKIAENYGSSL